MKYQLHIALFPFMAYGHTIPMLDMAKLFTSRGLKTTIISTPAFSEPIKQAQESGSKIELRLIKFPPKGSDLPDHIVSFDQAMTVPDLMSKFAKALTLLQEPFEALLDELNCNCLVSDMFLPWTVDSAAKHGIPRLVFHGVSYFSLCASEQMRLHKPYKKVSSDSETFVLPNLPHHLEFVRTQVSEYVTEGTENGLAKLKEQVLESEKKSYGVVMNSFYELESSYSDHYKNVVGRKAWPIGPLLLNNNKQTSSSQRGKKSSIEEHEITAWLDSKKPNSVVYMCFGSMATFTPQQLHETAIGLESSGQNFIWVVRKTSEHEEDDHWLPRDYEQRTKGRALIIRGWAPQVTILNHRSIAAFVTHCGWNSTLEGICAGVPLITWPVFAEQFFNEKLVTEVLRIGVSVGNKKWQRSGSEGVGRDDVVRAVKEVMIGEKALEMRDRARSYKDAARRAVEEGGSSYTSLDSLVDELRSYRP